MTIKRKYKCNFVEIRSGVGEVVAPNYRDAKKQFESGVFNKFYLSGQFNLTSLPYWENVEYKVPLSEYYYVLIGYKGKRVYFRFGEPNAEFHILYFAKSKKRVEEWLYKYRTEIINKGFILFHIGLVVVVKKFPYLLTDVGKINNELKMELLEGVNLPKNEKSRLWAFKKLNL